MNDPHLPKKAALVMMAGGKGTRFWPASRKRLPKQFLRIIGSRSLIEETFYRLFPLKNKCHLLIVINHAHRKLVDEIFPHREIEIIEEPYSRDTAPCIGLTAIYIENKWGDIPFVCLPADHYIRDEQKFREVIMQSIEISEKEEAIVTIGIPPQRPETGYGYIKKGRKYKDDIFVVEKFVEKPDYKKACEFLHSREYLWNSGIFIFRPYIILKEIHNLLPDLYNALQKLKEALKEKDNTSILKIIYRDIESISIDYGIMEKTLHKVYTVAGDFGWSDVGSWKALYELRFEQRDVEGNLIQGQAILKKSRNNFIFSQTPRLICTLGLEKMLIVDTADVLLVTSIDKDQEIRQLIEEVKKRNGKQWL